MALAKKGIVDQIQNELGLTKKQVHRNYRIPSGTDQVQFVIGGMGGHFAVEYASTFSGRTELANTHLPFTNHQT